MKDFKAKWQIDNNWQLIAPLTGVLLSFFSGYRIAYRLLESEHLILLVITTLISSIVIIKLSVFVINKLENKWVVKQKWELIRIFIVFALTGSSSVFIGRPFINWIGLSLETLPSPIYWLLFIIISLVLYQILLLTLGWLSGQFAFFWEFEKRFLKRMGLGRFFLKSFIIFFYF